MYSKIRAEIVAAMKARGADTIASAAEKCPELLRDYIANVKAESEKLLIYSFMTAGFKRIIYAADRYEAIQAAQIVAQEVNTSSWLLYSQDGELIHEGR